MGKSAAVIEFISFFLHRHLQAHALRSRNNGCQLTHGIIDADSPLSRMKIGYHCGHSSQMIGVRMRDRHHIQVIDASIP
jgi:hypothetical protein